MSAETSSKKTPYGLIISVALNGLLVGLLAGVLLAGGPPGRGGPPGPGPGGDPGAMDRDIAHAILQTAPSDDRAEIRKTMREAWRDTEGDREVIHQARETIAQSITAETFDRQAVSEAFGAWRAADGRIKTVVQEAMIDALANLSPERRQALAEEMEQNDVRRKDRRDRFRDRMEARRERRDD